MTASSIYPNTFKPLARRLVGRFNQGSFVHVQQTTTPNIDPSLPPVVSSVDVPYQAVARGVSAQAKIADPMIANCDYVVTIDAEQGYMPDVADIVKVNGRNCAIVRVDAIPPMGVVCVYKIYVVA